MLPLPNRRQYSISNILFAWQNYKKSMNNRIGLLQWILYSNLKFVSSFRLLGYNVRVFQIYSLFFINMYCFVIWCIAHVTIKIAIDQTPSIYLIMRHYVFKHLASIFYDKFYHMNEREKHLRKHTECCPVPLLVFFFYIFRLEDDQENLICIYSAVSIISSMTALYSNRICTIFYFYYFNYKKPIFSARIFLPFLCFR